MSLLPYSKSSIVDETRGITAAAPPASLNIASVIVSDTGPTERLTITSQQDLIDNYCTGSLIPADSHISLLYNAALLNRVPVDIIRVSTSNIRVGIGSLGNLLYFNEYYELLDSYTEFAIEPTSEIAQNIGFKVDETSVTGLAELKAKLGELRINEVKVLNDNNILVDTDTYYFNKKPLITTVDSIKSPEFNKLLTVNSNAYASLKHVSSDPVDLESLLLGGNNNININNLTFNETDSVIDIMKKTSALNPIIIQYRELANVSGVEVDGEDGDGEEPPYNYIVELLYPRGTGISIVSTSSEWSYYGFRTMYSYNVPTETDIEATYPASYSITIGTTTYSSESEEDDDNTIYLATDTYAKFRDKLISKLMERYQLAINSDGTIILEGTFNVDTVEGSSLLLKFDPIVTNQSGIEDAFAIVSRFPTSMDLFKFSYVYKDNEDYKPIELEYSYNGQSDNITISMDSMSMDGFGNSLYFDKYNEGPSANKFIYIAQLDNYAGSNGYKSKYESRSFGSQIMPMDPSSAAIADTILRYLEHKDKQYNFITDAGMLDSTVQSACERVANERFMQYPVSMKSSKKISELVSDYENPLNTFQAYYLYAPHKSNYTGNYLVEMPGSLVYMFARIDAYSSTVGEFIPLFGSTKGAVSLPNPVKIFNNDDDAQKLADLNINTVARNSSGIYIRSNFTAQKVNSYLSEEQFVYITNLICHICEEYNPSIQGETNDTELWNKIITDISSRISNRITMGKSPTITRFKVVCDGTLNTPQMIEQRTVKYQVWVQYTPTVAYVLAYTHIKRLNSF